MGSSYVQFKGKGFWSGDLTIELWEHLVVREIDKLDNPPAWLQALRERWHEWAQSRGVDVNSIFLDREIETDEQRQILITIAQSTLLTIEQYGNFIPKAVVEAFPMHEGLGGWNSDEDVTDIKCFGIYFLKLLNSEYPLTGSDWGGRIEYLSQEKVHERWSLLVQQKNSSS